MGPVRPFSLCGLETQQQLILYLLVFLRSQERIPSRYVPEGDSPGYGAQVPGLQLVNDVRLQHHGLAVRHLLPQQVSHCGGEL